MDVPGSLLCRLIWILLGPAPSSSRDSSQGRGVPSGVTWLLPSLGVSQAFAEHRCGWAACSLNQIALVRLHRVKNRLLFVTVVPWAGWGEGWRGNDTRGCQPLSSRAELHCTGGTTTAATAVAVPDWRRTSVSQNLSSSGDTFLYNVLSPCVFIICNLRPCSKHVFVSRQEAGYLL